MSALKTLAAFAATAAVLSAVPALAQGDLPPGMTTDTQKVSDLPGLAGFYKLSPAEHSQFGVYYAVKIKHASLAGSSAVINDGDRKVPVRLGPDGRIEPTPTREQVEHGATITVTYPAAASKALKLRVFSTQPAGHDYDAQGLALGIRQANNAMGKIGGILVMALPRLDRVYFVGAGSGSVETGGQTQPLPKFQGDNEVPAGTPYFVPSQAPNATKIHLSGTPSLALFANPPK